MRTLMLLVALTTLPAAEVQTLTDAGAVSGGDSVLRGISDDGRFVLFESDGHQAKAAGAIFPTDGSSIYLRDRGSFVTRVVVDLGYVAPGAGQSALSGNGAVIAFVPPVAIGGTTQVYAWVGGTTSLVSCSLAGVPGDRASQAPALSDAGDLVAFASTADNLTADGAPGVFRSDVFVKNRASGVVTCVSLAPDGRADTGESGGAAISRNGRRVAFYSTSTQLVAGMPADAKAGVYVRDLIAGTTVRADVASDGTIADQAPHTQFPPALSGDGRYVVFASPADNLVAGDDNGAIDVFVRDLVANTTSRVSVATSGAQGNDLSIEPSISLDGRFVLFRSFASGLVGGDTNGACDVFVRDRLAATTYRVDFGYGGAQADDDALAGARIAGGGGLVAFTTRATTIVPGIGGHAEVYLNNNDPRFTVAAFRRVVELLIQRLRQFLHLQVPPQPPQRNG